MYVRNIVDAQKKGFTIRQLIGETEYTKFMAKFYGMECEEIKPSKR